MNLAQSIAALPPQRLSCLVGALSGIGALVAALSFQELSRANRRELVASLARHCRRPKNFNLPDTFSRHRPYELENGLRKSAAIALCLGLPADAMTISLRAPHHRPHLWSLTDDFDHDVFPFLFRIALRAAVKKEPIHERDLLPHELVAICSRISREVTGKAFRDKAKDRIGNYFQKKSKDGKQSAPLNSLSYKDRERAERFLTQRLEPLVVLTRSFSAVLSTDSRCLDKTFRKLIRAWEAFAKNDSPYQHEKIDHFLSQLGFNIAFFVLWSRPGLQKATVKRFLTVVHRYGSDVHNLVRIVAILAQRKALRSLAGEQAMKVRALIEKEDEVNLRASLFGALGRAMLPASIDEASTYFRDGLEQMDAIGSGDYQFTNGLLLFTSQMRGDELEDRDLHTLTNICELNMGEEPEKLYGSAYAHGISRAAGLRGLAKLSRWDDRSTIALRNTLLPYLTSLLEHGKIDATDALALNRLANPVEQYFASTKEFAEALRHRAGPDPVVITELITQFQDDKPDSAMSATMETLATLAREALGSAQMSKHLDTVRLRYAEVRDMQNERSNYRGNGDLRIDGEEEGQNSTNLEALKRIAAVTNPIDEASLSNAIDQFNALGNMYELKGEFFTDLRKKVSYEDRAKYVRNVSGLENLFFYWKFAELKEAREAWGASSAALNAVYLHLAYPLVAAHAQDLVVDGHLFDSSIREISDVTGVGIPDLTIELIKVFARPNIMVSGSVWLALATFICPEAEAGQGQLALTRLLSSEAAKLADSVADGGWSPGFYPPDEFVEIAAGVVWRVLGSPYAIDRWRAAHCLLSFAKFGRWEVIDNVVARIGHVDAGPFQARELPFFHMHARLWLLITLARMGQDYPAQIARYRDNLLSYVLEAKDPHVLIRHFACRTLQTCLDTGKLELSAEATERLREADRSPHERLNEKLRDNGGFYSDRPKSVPKRTTRYYLDYDFHKMDVDGLSQVFGQPCWKVADMMAGIVHRIDPTVKTMYEAAGRESRYRRVSYGMTTRYHTHGQQLGWHALFLAAGKLLRDHPVTDDSWYEYDSCGEPWGEWFARYGLTRDDGVWLSDGTDRTPLDTVKFLLQKKKNDLVIIGGREKMLALAGLSPDVGKELVVQGRWFSVDNVRVDISSALVPPRMASAMARRLIREEPMFVWVPCFDENEDDSEFVRGDKKEYRPWIVCPSGGAQLDEHDPYGVSLANFRPRLAHEFTTRCSLSKKDAFGRVWNDRRGRPVLSAEAWGRDDNKMEDGPHAGTRLICASSLLRRILTKYDRDLLILLKLERYVKESNHSDSCFAHSVSVARITKACDLEYFGGRVNHTHETQW